MCLHIDFCMRRDRPLYCPFTLIAGIWSVTEPPRGCSHVTIDSLRSSRCTTLLALGSSGYSHGLPRNTMSMPETSRTFELHAGMLLLLVALAAAADTVMHLLSG